MFDVSWSELLILGLVTLVMVGPKELPRFMRTLGRYLGIVRRQANEFRSVFEQAMREAEMDEIQKEVRSVSDGVKASLDEATRSIDSAKDAAQAKPPSRPSHDEPPQIEDSSAPPAGPPAAADEFGPGIPDADVGAVEPPRKPGVA